MNAFVKAVLRVMGLPVDEAEARMKAARDTTADAHAKRERVNRIVDSMMKKADEIHDLADDVIRKLNP